MLNTKGIRFLQIRTTPLHIDTTDKAAGAIGKILAERDARIQKGEPLASDTDVVEFGRHCAWLIAFDALIEDRKAIHDIVSKLDGEAR